MLNHSKPVIFTKFMCKTIDYYIFYFHVWIYIIKRVILALTKGFFDSEKTFEEVEIKNKENEVGKLDKKRKENFEKMVLFIQKIRNYNWQMKFFQL